MKRWIFTCLLSILAVAFSHAQQVILSGTIRDAKSEEPLISATVKVGGQGTVTDFDGKYQLELEPGKYEIEASYIGYESRTKSITLAAGQNQELNFFLNESSTMLQTATVTSGKFEKPLGEVTVSMEVIQPQLVESVNSTSVDEVLEKVPGVTIVDGQPNIRGGSGFSYGAGSRVLILVDDLPMLQADAGFPNWDDLPVENIQQVEVVKGAASALYGSSALNGIINIRTGYATSEPEFKGSLFNTHFLAPNDPAKKWWTQTPQAKGGSLSYKRRFNKFDLVLSSFAYQQTGFNKHENDYYRRATINTRYRVSDKLSFGVNANFNAGESNSYFFWRDAEAGAHSGALNTYTLSERVRYNVDPFLTYFDGIGNRHKLMGRYYSVNNNVSNNQSNFSQSYYGEYQFQRQMEEADLVVTAGGVVYATGVDAELYGDTTFSSLNLAGYLQLDKKFFDRLNLSAGFRYESFKLNNPGLTYFNGLSDVVIDPTVEQEAKPVFRLGANYQLADYTYVRASWGQGYRYPTIAEKFIVTTFGGVPISPSPDLQSETGWSTELGLKQGFRLLGFEGFVDVAAFWTEYQDMMQFTFVNLFPTGFQSLNVGDTRIRGMELSVAGRGDLFGVLPSALLTGYTYIDPRFAEFDIEGKTLPPSEVVTDGQANARNSSAGYNILKYRSRHTFKLDWQSTYEQWSLGVAVFYAAHVEAIDEILEILVVPGLEGYRRNNDQGYTTYNFRLAYSIDEKKRLSFLLNNAFNVEYSLRPGLLEAPRNFTIRLDYGF